MDRIQENRRIILIGLVALLLVCLVAVLAYNIFSSPGGPDIAGQPVTATPAPTEEPTLEPSAADSGDAGDDTNTPTPTRVVSDDTEDSAGETAEDQTSEDDDEDEAEATAEPTTDPTDQPTATPTPTPDAGASTTTMVPQVVETTEVVTQTDELLKNGSFERGFAPNGVGRDWDPFRTTDAAVNFAGESALPYILNGDAAQRISIDLATEPDQYGGIYQTVDVSPGQVYSLTLHGQIRSGFGSVEASSYGYRMQYAVDYEGGQNWRQIPADEWIELPWDEQGFEAPEFTFSEYSTELTPTSDRLTLFIRGWNKWPNQALGEYTLDSLSLVGPVTMTRTVTNTIMVASSGTGSGTQTGGDATSGADSGDMVDGALPVTGTAEMLLMADGRFWGGVIVLLLLAVGAVARAKWRW